MHERAHPLLKIASVRTIALSGFWYCLRDYLVVTRAVDPTALEQARIAAVTAGFSPGQQGQRTIRPDSMLDALSYVTFQELATRVSHRNTGKACAEPVADELLKRVAADETGT